MGTDITFWVEKKRKGAWETAGRMVDDPWSSNKEAKRREDFYSSRNYEVFSVLANVRNEYDIPFIAEPRGLPEDMSPDVCESAHDPHNIGVFHASWLLLSEILAFDWTQTYIHDAVTSLYDYWKWKALPRSEGEMPSTYSAGVSGPKVRVVSAEEADELIAENEPNYWLQEEDFARKVEGSRNYYVGFSLERPLWSACDDFLGTCVPRLRRLGSPKNVRAVFWYDQP